MRCKSPGIKVFIILFLSLCSLLPLKAFAGEPTEQVKQTIEEVRKVFKNEDLRRPEKRAQRNARLREIVGGRFDFEEMAKRSLALYWKDRTPEERKEFVSLYSDLLRNVYLKQIQRHEHEIKKHEDDKVVYLGEKRDGSYASVQTRVITTTGREIPVEYKLLDRGGTWKAYDVYIEGVSLINNYRTQFNQIIRSGSYEELVRKLKAKDLSAPGGKKSGRLFHPKEFKYADLDPAAHPASATA